MTWWYGEVKMGGMHRGIRGFIGRVKEDCRPAALDVLIHEEEGFFCRFDQPQVVWRSLEFCEPSINGRKERCSA